MQNLNLLPEESLLISLCRLEFSEEKKGEIYGLVKRVTDWENFTNAANNHGVIALIHDNIQKLGLSELIPEKQRNILYSGFLKSIARNSLISKIASELDQIAAKENIRVVLLKGLALERTIYGDKGLRQMTDLDVLVAPDDAMKLRRAMMLNGFEAAPFISRIYEKKMFVEGKHLPEITKYGIDIEIHIKLFDQKGNSSTEQLMERSYSSVFYKNLFIPDPKLHFLYLIKHLCKHECEGSSQLRMYADLVLLLAQDSLRITDEELLKYAMNIRLGEKLKCKLKILNIFWGIPLPEYLDSILDFSERKLFIQFLRSPEKVNVTLNNRPFRPLTFIEGVSNKILFITGFAFPSGTFLRYKYKKEKGKPLFFLYAKWWYSIILNKMINY